MDTAATQPAAPQQERPSHGPASESPREDNTSRSEDLHAVVNVLLAQIVQVVKKLLQRPENTPTGEEDLNALLRGELVAAIMGGERQQPPPPTQRESRQQNQPPAEEQRQNGGTQ